MTASHAGFQIRRLSTAADSRILHARKRLANALKGLLSEAEIVARRRPRSAARRRAAAGLRGTRTAGRPLIDPRYVCEKALPHARSAGADAPLAVSRR